MKPWKVVALLTLPMLLFAAWRIWSIYKERHEPVAVKQEPPERKISQDDLVIPRKMHIESLKSAKKELKGQTVWMQAGYQLEYYPIEVARRSSTERWVRYSATRSCKSRTWWKSPHPLIG